MSSDQTKSQSSGKRKFLQDIPKNEEKDIQNQIFKEIDALILEEERIERLSLSTPTLPRYHHPNSNGGGGGGSGHYNHGNVSSSTMSIGMTNSSGYSSGASTSNVMSTSVSSSDMEDDDDDMPQSHRVTVYRSRSNTQTGSSKSSSSSKHGALNHLTPQQQQSLSTSSIQQQKSASHSFLPSFLPSFVSNGFGSGCSSQGKNTTPTSSTTLLPFNQQQSNNNNQNNNQNQNNQNQQQQIINEQIIKNNQEIFKQQFNEKDLVSPQSSTKSGGMQSVGSGGSSMSINNLVNAESTEPAREPGFSPTPSPHSSTQFSPQSSTQFSLQFSAINLNHHSSGSLSNMMSSPYSSYKQMLDGSGKYASQQNSLNTMLSGWAWVKSRHSIVIVGPANIGKSFLVNTILRSSFIPSSSRPILSSHRAHHKTSNSGNSSSTTSSTSSLPGTGDNLEYPHTYLLNKLKSHLAQSSGSMPAKIDQQFTMDEPFYNSMDWTRERELEMESIYRMSQFMHTKTASMTDNHVFMLPQGRLGSTQLYRISYGAVCEMVVEFMSEGDLRAILWELHTHDADRSLPVNPRRLEYLTWTYASVVEGSTGTVMTTSGSGTRTFQLCTGAKSSWDLPLVEGVKQLLGKTVQFKGTGRDHQLDRVYVREKLKETLACYGFIVGSFSIRLPCSILLGRREITILSDDTKRGSVSKFTITRTLDDADQILLAFDYRGLSTDTADLLISSKFINKLTTESAVHFIELGEQYQNKTPYPKGIYNSKGLIIHQLKKLYRNSRNVNFDSILDNFKLIQIMPLLYASVELNKSLTMEYRTLGFTSLKHLKDHTNVPQLIRIMQKSSQPSWASQHNLLDKFKEGVSKQPSYLLNYLKNDQQNQSNPHQQQTKPNNNNINNQSQNNNQQQAKQPLSPIMMVDSPNLMQDSPTLESQSINNNIDSKMMIDEEFKLSSSFRENLHINHHMNGGMIETNGLNHLANVVVATALPVVLDSTNNQSSSNSVSSINSGGSNSNPSPSSSSRMGNWRNQYAQYRTISGQQGGGTPTNASGGMDRITTTFRARFAGWKRKLLTFASSEASESAFLTKVTECEVCAKLEWERFRVASPDVVTTVPELCSNIYANRGGQSSVGNVAELFNSAAYNPVLLLCKPLISWTPSFWRENVVERLPLLEEEIIVFSRTLLTDISKLLLNKIVMSNDERAQHVKLLQYCQSATDRNIRNKMAGVRTYLEQNMTSLVYSLCIETLCTELTLRVANPKQLVNYHDLVERCFHSVPLMSSSRIQQKLLEILKYAVSALDSMEKHLEHTMQYLLNSPFRLKRQLTQKPTPQPQQPVVIDFTGSVIENYINLVDPTPQPQINPKLIINDIVGNGNGNGRSPIKQSSTTLFNNLNNLSANNSNISFVNGMIVVKPPSPLMFKKAAQVCDGAAKTSVPLVNSNHASNGSSSTSTKSGGSGTLYSSIIDVDQDDDDDDDDNNNEYVIDDDDEDDEDDDDDVVEVTSNSSSMSPRSPGDKMEVDDSAGGPSKRIKGAQKHSDSSEGLSSVIYTPPKMLLPPQTAAPLLQLAISKVCQTIHTLTTVRGSSMPEELLQKIITFLITQERVKGGSVISNQLDDHILARLLSPLMVTLDLEGARLLSGTSLRAIGATCTQLKKLVLSYCTNVSSEALGAIGAGCKSLEVLVLKGCHQLNNAGVLALARVCQNLTHVDLSGCIKVTDSAVHELHQNNRRLQSLDLRRCVQLTDAAFQSFAVTTLTHIDLVECNFITDIAVVNIVNASKALASIKLSGRGITDSSLRRLASRCRLHLSSLDLVMCDNVTDSAIRTLFASCGRLHTVNLCSSKNLSTSAFQIADEFDDNSIGSAANSMTNLSSSMPGNGALVMALDDDASTTTTGSSFTHNPLLSDMSSASALKSLVHLDLNRCINVNDASVLALTMYATQLETISLAWCEDITDESVMTISQRCTQLKNLDLTKCKHITDTAVIEIAKRKNNNLARLVLFSCVQVTDRAVVEIATHCHSLIHLDLSQCEKVSDVSLVKIAQGLPLLRVLCMEECAITDTGVSALGSIAQGYGCQFLEVVKFGYCRFISDAALERIAIGCPSVCNVDLSYCSNLITPRGLRMLIQAWPRLHTLRLRGYISLTSESLVDLDLTNPSSSQQQTSPPIKLKTVNMSWCANLEDTALVRFASHCPSLESLDISRCPKITDNALEAIIDTCPSIRLVNVAGCKEITPFTIQKLSSLGKTIYR